MLEILNYLKARYMSEKAQGMTEYAVVVALVVMIAVAVYTTTGGDYGLKLAITDLFGRISNEMDKILPAGTNG